MADTPITHAPHAAWDVDTPPEASPLWRKWAAELVPSLPDEPMDVEVFSELAAKVCGGTGLTRHLLAWCETYGVLKGIRVKGGWRYWVTESGRQVQKAA